MRDSRTHHADRRILSDPRRGLSGTIVIEP